VLTATTYRRIADIGPANWNQLAQGGSFFDSYMWLAGVESERPDETWYVAIRDGTTIVASMPCYLVTDPGIYRRYYNLRELLMSETVAAWASEYLNDTGTPFAQLALEFDETINSRWVPYLLCGSRSGYHATVLTAGEGSAKFRHAVMTASGRSSDTGCGFRINRPCIPLCPRSSRRSPFCLKQLGLRGGAVVQRGLVRSPLCMLR